MVDHLFSNVNYLTINLQRWSWGAYADIHLFAIFRYNYGNNDGKKIETFLRRYSGGGRQKPHRARWVYVMYWNRQEQFIFDVILFMLVVLQVSTFFVLKSGMAISQYSLILASFNVFFFLVMIPYAKWVWRTPTYLKAFLQLAKHEVILLAVIVLGILLTVLLNTGIKHT